MDVNRQKLESLYAEHAELPYISPERDIQAFLNDVPVKLVSKYNMTRLENGLLPGDIIMLWRVSFDTFTTQSWFPKYFEYTYGIDAKQSIKDLVSNGYVEIETAFNSIDHLNAAQVKKILQEKGVKGLSKCSRGQLNQLLNEHYTEEELAPYVTVRGYLLTEKGKVALEQGQEVVDKHPKKKY